MTRVETPLSLATSGTLDLILSAARIVSPSGPQLACK
jgi:beta-glucosidase